MERRELYHPEDIEQLLLERAYDDLLEEERAFVLRHLAGRAEYTAMRALLLKMRNDEPTADADADPQVRERVLQVFRTQQRASWQVWLNSVALWFWPADVRAMWRPALAIASVAVVAVVAVVATQRTERAAPQLAEVRTEKEVTAPVLPPAPAVAPVEENGSNMQGQLEQTQADRGDGTSAAGGTRTVTTEPMREQTSANGQVQAALDEEAQPGTVASLPFQLKKEDTAKNNADSVVPASAMDIDHVSHAVSANELSSNMSTASESIRSTAFGATRHKVDALKDKQRASTDASDIRLAASSDEGDRTGTDLIGLLKAAW